MKQVTPVIQEILVIQETRCRMELETAEIPVIQATRVIQVTQEKLINYVTASEKNIPFLLNLPTFRGGAQPMMTATEFQTA
jgi:hypothetical protein